MSYILNTLIHRQMIKTLRIKIPLLLSLAFVLSLFSTCNSEDENEEVKAPITYIGLRQVRLEYNDSPNALSFNIEGNLDNPNGTVNFIYDEGDIQYTGYSHEHTIDESIFDQNGYFSVNIPIAKSSFPNILQRANPTFILYPRIAQDTNFPPGCGSQMEDHRPNALYKTYIDGEAVSNLASASKEMVALPMKFDDPAYSTEESHTYTIEIYECYGYCNTNEYDKIADQKGQIDVTIHYVP